MRQERGSDPEEMDMHKLIVLFLAATFALASLSMAEAGKARKPGYGAVVIAPQPSLLPEAAAMANARKMWPNTPLCDDGGYRIRPCYMGDGAGRQ